MTSLYAYFTVLITFLFLTACGAKSTADKASSSLPLAAPGTAQALVAVPSASSIVPGATTTFSVIGGTAPYNWVVTSGGGTLGSNTGMSVVYTASTSGSGLAYVTVSDSAGHSTSASVNVVSATTTPPVNTTAGNICQGNYAVMLGTYQAGAQLTTTGSTLTGMLSYAGHQYPLQGSCSTSGVSFVLTETGDTFSGTFVANPSGAPRAAINGNYTNVYYGSTQTWTATPQ